MRKLNYVWRLFVTGYCFTMFGLGGCFLGLIWFPTLALVTHDEQILRYRIRRSIQLCFKLFFWVLHNARLFEFSVVNAHKLLEDRGTIIVANHPSLIDVVALMSITPHVSCIVKKDLFHNPFLRWVVRGAGYVPNDESERILDLCKEALDRGDNIIIFPEGTRTVPGKPLNLKRGAAQIAFRLGAPVRMVRILVNPITLTKGEPWYSIPERRAQFYIEVLNIISTQEMAAEGLVPSVAARRITREIGQNIDPSKMNMIAFNTSIPKGTPCNS